MSSNEEVGKFHRNPVRECLHHCVQRESGEDQRGDTKAEFDAQRAQAAETAAQTASQIALAASQKADEEAASVQDSARRANDAIARLESATALPPPPPEVLATAKPMASAPLSSRVILPAEFSYPPNLGAIAAKFITALHKTGYVDGGSYYSIPHGFAIATQIEHIKQDGSPMPGAERWHPNPLPPRT